MTHIFRSRRSRHTQNIKSRDACQKITHAPQNITLAVVYPTRPPFSQNQSCRARNTTRTLWARADVSHRDDYPRAHARAAARSNRAFGCWLVLPVPFLSVYELGERVSNGKMLEFYIATTFNTQLQPLLQVWQLHWLGTWHMNE